MSDLTIEAELRSSRGRLIATSVFGAAAVVADFALVLTEQQSWIFPRMLLATIVLVVYIHLGAGKPPGFRIPSWPEWRGWLTFLGVGGTLLAVGATLAHLWFDVPFRDPHTQLSWVAVNACVAAPIYEEVIYRVALASPSAALLGRRWAIVLNGLVFAGLHVAYGNPDPSNAVGGFVLAWIYLRSRSVALAILAHAIGNLAINFGPVLYEHLRT